MDSGRGRTRTGAGTRMWPRSFEATVRDRLGPSQSLSNVQARLAGPLGMGGLKDTFQRSTQVRAGS